jgi:MFS family permease
LVSLKKPEDTSVLRTMKVVGKNKNFVVLTFVFSLVQGAFYCFGATLD